jgi:hypothetical protein
MIIVFVSSWGKQRISSPFGIMLIFPPGQRTPSLVFFVSLAKKKKNRKVGANFFLKFVAFVVCGFSSKVHLRVRFIRAFLSPLKILGLYKTHY